MSLTVEQYEQKYFIANDFCINDIILISKSLKEQGFTTMEGKPDTKIYTRLTAIFISWLLSSKNEISDQEFIHLLDSYPEWIAVIQLSGFDSADHVLSILYNPQNEKLFNIHKLLLSYLPNSKAQINLLPFFQLAPDTLLSFFLTQLSEKNFLSMEANSYRNTLLNFKLPILDYKITPKDLNKIGNAWMFCSYADIENKHDIKRPLNKVIQQWLVSTLPKQRLILPSIKNNKSKKTILIIAEHMQANHALFRSYACWIQELKDSFEVNLLVEADKIDDASAKLFEKIHYLKFPINFEQTVKQIHDVAPDLIFYPSLGMCSWTIVLSNLRLARIQTIGLGHPATSMSDNIDYLIVADGTVNKQTRCSEKLVLIPRQQMSFPEAIPDCQIRVLKDTPTLKVAIASSSMKITYKFLLTLEKIQKLSKKRIEFHFFTGEVGVSLQKLSYELQQVLINVFCYPLSDYQSYMTNLGQCELLLETFPFGGTNSNIDALLLSIPIVCLNGDEPHSLIDKVIIDAAGLPSSLATDSIEAYISTAIKIIENIKYRKKMQKILSKNKIRDFLSAPGEKTPDNGFSKAIHWIIEHHDKIQLSDEKYWTEDERSKFN